MADSSWTEPESAANTEFQPVYPYNHVTETESGHLFELDDTPTRERIRLQHRTGTFIEMHPNGDEVHKVYGDGYEITIKNKNVLVQGQCNITIEGDSVLHVRGDAYTKIDGDCYQEIGRDVEQLINGDCKQNIEGDYDLNTSGNFNIYASNVNINSDLNVTGDIGSNQSISAVGNVTAELNLSAKLSVQTPGFMTAGVSMTSPLGSFVTMRATLMTDSINKALHNIHRHAGKVFSGPKPPMV